jgi:hypothetical protein
MPGTPILLVGTKTDLRTNPEVVARLRAEAAAPLSPADGAQLAKELGAK